MKTATEIKNHFLETLPAVLDEPLKTVGFVRNRRSLVYARKVSAAEHRITVTIHSHPKYQPGAEAHIYPSVEVVMPKVSENALALVKGDKLLLANAPEIIIGEPIDFTAPKEAHQRWFATGHEQLVVACTSIREFLARWVLPFFAEVSTPSDLIRLYERNDARIMKQKYIFISAAYELTGQLDKAREVVRQQLGRPGLRKLYAPLFKTLAVE